ncbi:hypothetical protein MMC20_000665 [Loxospora ochrophaea]|nr:hypothetical protein [Loxospora ochrophaea]
MGRKRKQLTQAEIWDDSALLQSWDDALAEYKLYHSIHARGERVEDVLMRAETEDETFTSSMPFEETNPPHTNGASEAELEDGELEDDIKISVPINVTGNENGQIRPSNSSPTTEKESDASGAQPMQSNSSIPHGMMSQSTQDDTLKNLMMSWYWAGYYTGLHEGQQRAASHSAHQVSGNTSK